MEIFIEDCKVSINEYKGRFRLSNFVLFLGLILFGSIILSGTVSAVAQGTSHSIIVPSKNLTVSTMGVVNSQTKIQTNTVTKTSNSLKIPDPKVIRGGVVIGSYATISQAYSASIDGDTIMLDPGTYNEHSIFIYKNLNFKVSNNGHATINGANADLIFFIGQGRTVTFQNIIFTDGSYGWGGAIQNEGKLNVTDCTFRSNSAEGSGGAGGAIYNNGGNLTVTNCTFTNNTANSASGSYGGAICNYGGNLTVSNSSFTSNSAIGSGTGSCEGGAIYNTAVSNLNIKGCTFTNNTATSVNGGYGGAIYNYNDNTAIISFNRIVGNTATHGRVIYCNSGIVNANYNWWGINTGPKSEDVIGTIIQSWLVLKVTANPVIIGNNGKSTITANLRYDNHGNFAGGSFPNGIPITFKTNLGTINQASTSNGTAISTLKCGSTGGIANIFTKLDNQTVKTLVKLDTIPPKLVLTSPTNGATGFSRTANIGIKFSEYIKASSNWSKIVIKDKYGHAVYITSWISGTNIYIKTNPRAANSWYTVTIPKAAIKDFAGNNLLATYTFKFKTGA